MIGKSEAIMVALRRNAPLVDMKLAE